MLRQRTPRTGSIGHPLSNEEARRNRTEGAASRLGGSLEARADASSGDSAPKEVTLRVEGLRPHLPFPRRELVTRAPLRGPRLSGFRGNCPRYHRSLISVAPLRKVAHRHALQRPSPVLGRIAVERDADRPSSIAHGEQSSQDLATAFKREVRIGDAAPRASDGRHDRQKRLMRRSPSHRPRSTLCRHSCSESFPHPNRFRISVAKSCPAM